MRAPHCSLLVTVWCLVSGLLLLLGGLLALFLFTPLVNLIIQSKVVLLPGTDVAEAWIAPPIRPLLKIYYFNATNAEEYLSGGQLRVQEVGPYVWEERWQREEVAWSEDQEEVSFRMRRTYHHRPDLSAGSLEDPVILPNVPMFGMISKMRMTGGPDLLASANAFLEAQDPPQHVFEKRTVAEITWGYNHSLVTMANLVLPEDQRLPELYGYFYGKNDTADKEVRILTGKRNWAELGSIVSYDNRTRLDSWWEESTEDTEDAEMEDSEDEAGQCNSIRGTDGSVFPPLVTKDQVFHIFNKDMCRALPVEYSKTVTHHDMDTFRFVPSSKAFTSEDSACFCPPGEASCAPEGLFNVSACQGGAPMFLSWPHFYRADPRLREAVLGLEPREDKHQFHLDILPQLGVGLRAAVRLQINILLQTEGVDKLQNATDAYVPIVWFEDGVEELNDEAMVQLLRSAVVTPARIHRVLYPLLLALGGLLTAASLAVLVRRCSKRRMSREIEMSPRKF